MKTLKNSNPNAKNDDKNKMRLKQITVKNEVNKIIHAYRLYKQRLERKHTQISYMTSIDTSNNANSNNNFNNNNNKHNYTNNSLNKNINKYSKKIIIK